MIRKLQQQGQISVAKCVLPVNSFSPIGIQSQIVHIICALVNAFAIAIFVSTVPNTLQPIHKPLNKIGTFIFRGFFSFSRCFS